MKKVLYTTNLPVPYKIEFFKELGKYVDLTVVFERKYASNRDSEWLSTKIEGFKYIFMQGINCGIEGAFCHEVCKIIKENCFDEIIIGTYYTLTGMLAIQYLRSHGISYFLSTDGGFIKQDNLLKYRLKKHFISNAKGYFSPSEMTDKYLIHYGAKKDLIVRYPFTSLRENEILKKFPSIEEKKKIKEKLHIVEEKVVIGVGQFIPRKGWETLLQAAKNITSDIGIYIIGGKPTEEYSKLKNELKLNNVYFRDFVDKEYLKQYYLAADIFVLPTREDIWGLVINEAMSYGLPIITTFNCMAGLEMIENGENGYLIDVDNVEELERKINQIIYDEDKKNRLKFNSLNKVKKYTIENMAFCYQKKINCMD